MTVIAQRQLVNVPPNAQEDYVPNVAVSNNSQTITVSPQGGLSSSQCIIHVLAQDA